MSTNNTAPTQWWDDIDAWPALDTPEDQPHGHDEWGWLNDLPADSPDRPVARPATRSVGKGRSWPRPQRRALIAVGALASVAVVTAGVVVLTSSPSGDHRSPVVAAIPSTSTGTASTSTTPAPADECPSTSQGGVVTGNDPGDQASGPGVIKAFQYAYYTRRSATAALAVTAPSARLNSVTMQTFIDKRPIETGYCLTITDRGAGLYALKLTETTPGTAPEVYRQLIETTRASGKTWITAIKSDASTTTK